MRKSRFTEEQISRRFKEHEAGARSANSAASWSQASNTFYRWRASYGGMEVTTPASSRRSRRERRLKHIVPTSRSTWQMLKSGERKKMVTARRSAQAAGSSGDFGVSERRACASSSCPRATCRYPAASGWRTGSCARSSASSLPSGRG